MYTLIFSLYGINMHLIINIESLCNIFVYGLLEVKHHKAMMCNGCRYHIKKLDETKKTSYCGISTIFEVTNVSSRSDRHPEILENRHYGYLEYILQCDFKSFKVVMFVVKLYKLRLNQHDLDRTCQVMFFSSFDFHTSIHILNLAFTFCFQKILLIGIMLILNF